MSMEQALKLHTEQDDKRFVEIIEINQRQTEIVYEIKTMLARNEERELAKEKQLQDLISSIKDLSRKVEINSDWVKKNDEWVDGMRKTHKIEKLANKVDAHEIYISNKIDQEKDTRKIILEYVFKFGHWAVLALLGIYYNLQ